MCWTKIRPDIPLSPCEEILRGLPNLFMLLDCGLTPVDGSYVMILHIAVTVPRAKVNTSRLHSGII